MPLTPVVAIAAGILGEVLFSVAGQVAGQTLYDRYRQFMVGHRQNHDLQKAMAHAYINAIKALYRSYFEERPAIQREEQALLAERFRRLDADKQQLEAETLSGGELARYLAKTPQEDEQFGARLLEFVRSRHLDGAPPGFTRYVEARLEDTIRFFLWEELKVDEAAIAPSSTTS